jgi:hypothetical protein
MSQYQEVIPESKWVKFLTVTQLLVGRLPASMLYIVRVCCVICNISTLGGT